MSAHLKHSDYIPLLKGVGADWLVVSNGPIVSLGILETPGAVSTVPVVLPFELADANYAVIAQAEGRNDLHVDESTKTTTGFDIVTTGAALGASDVVNVIVMGSRKATQPRPI